MTDRKLKHALCGRLASWFEGITSGLKYVRVLSCYDRLCPSCGNKGGQIHKRRARRVLDKIKRQYGSLDGLVLRKFVFTLPASIRNQMRNKKSLNAFFVDVEKLLKPLFPGRQIHLSLHPFGDRDHDYKPHVNAYVVARRNVSGGCQMRISPEMLAMLKRAYVSALVRRGFDVESVDVHYSFTLDRGRFLHGVKYLTRPCPDEKTLSALEVDAPDLFDFMMSDEMKGFQFIRSLRVEVALDQFMAGVGVIKFEKMRFIKKVAFSWSVFIDTFRYHERVEVFPGFYAIRPGGLSADDLRMFRGCEDG
jgi:hypothetical protein